MFLSRHTTNRAGNAYLSSSEVVYTVEALLLRGADHVRTKPTQKCVSTGRGGAGNFRVHPRKSEEPRDKLTSTGRGWAREIPLLSIGERSFSRGRRRVRSSLRHPCTDLL
jgi:hypothetical protein